MKKFTKEDLEKNLKRLSIEARDRLRKYLPTQMLKHFCECEIQLEEQISQEYLALVKRMEMRINAIENFDESVTTFTGAALLAGVITVGALILQHIK